MKNPYRKIEKDDYMKKVIVYGGATLLKNLFFDAAGNTNFQIACFTSDEGYRGDDQLLGLPWVGYDKILDLYPPDQYDMLALFNGSRSMRARDKMYQKAKSSGYKLRNYISARADIAPDVLMGENNVIMGASYIGFGGIMGDNNLIRQSVYLGHEFEMGNNNIITAGCNIGGLSNIKNNCYFGLGSTVIDHINIAEETLIGAGSLVIRHTEPYSKNVGNPSRIIGYHLEEGPGTKLREQ